MCEISEPIVIEIKIEKQQNLKSRMNSETILFKLQNMNRQEF